MALINCPQCGQQVSDRASNCPKCGYSLYNNKMEYSSYSQQKTKNSTNILKIIIPIVIVQVLIIILIVNRATKNTSYEKLVKTFVTCLESGDSDKFERKCFNKKVLELDEETITDAVEDFEKLRAAIIIVYKHIDSIRYEIYDSGDFASKSECRSSGLNCDGYQDGITIRIYVNGDSDGFTLYLEAIKYGSGWYIADMYW